MYSNAPPTATQGWIRFFCNSRNIPQPEANSSPAINSLGPVTTLVTQDNRKEISWKKTRELKGDSRPPKKKSCHTKIESTSRVHWPPGYSVCPQSQLRPT